MPRQDVHEYNESNRDFLLSCRKGYIFDLAMRKNRTRTMGTNKEFFRSHVSHPRLQLG